MLNIQNMFQIRKSMQIHNLFNSKSDHIQICSNLKMFELKLF
jgi:hypothetical protein